MIVRPAEDADLDELTEIHVLGWQHAYVGIVPQHHLDGMSRERVRQRWLERLSEGVISTWVTVTNDDVTGFVTVHDSRDHEAATAEVGGIYVHPEHWHTGAGSRLWQKALEWAGENGARQLMAWTFEQNSRALAFYRAMGCRPTGDRRPYSIAGAEIPGIRVSMAVPIEMLSNR